MINAFPQSTPCRFANLPNSQYHQSEGVSKSGVMLLLRSPQHYRAAYETSREPTPAMLLGSLVHTLVLEPEKFESEYAIAPQVDKRTKAGKAEWESFDAACGEKAIVTPAQLEQAQAMAAAVRFHQFAGPALTGIEAEHSFYWHDAESGVLAKCRPDAIKTVASGLVLLDLKTTDDASPQAFAKTCAAHGYHVSAAMSMDGVEAVTGQRPLSYRFVVIERNPPYGIAVYELEDQAVSFGRMLYRSALQVFRDCTDIGEWKGYPTATQKIDLPKWAYFEA